MTDLHGKKVIDIPLLLLKLLLPIAACAVFVLLVVVDFSNLREKVKGFWSSSKQEKSQLQVPDEKAGRDIVVNQEDLDKAYKELFTEKRVQVEKDAAEAEEGVKVVYLIELVSGKTILATEVLLEDDRVRLKDEKGFVMVMHKSEITGIRKKHSK